MNEKKLRVNIFRVEALVIITPVPAAAHPLPLTAPARALH